MKNYGLRKELQKENEVKSHKNFRDPDSSSCLGTTNFFR